MMPNGKLLALVLVFGAVVVAAGTGAFTTVEAERTAEVNVTGDANALLALEEPEGISAGAVNEGGDGTASIDLTGDELGDAQGLNPNANTTLTPLLNVTNNGENDVDLTVTIDGTDGDIEDVSIVSADNEEFDPDTMASGDTEQFGLEIETGDLVQEDDLDIDITIEANETE